MLETVVFGRRSGQRAAEIAGTERWVSLSEAAVSRYMEPWNSLLAWRTQAKQDDSPFAIQQEATSLMTRQVGVFRDGPELEDAVKRLAELKERYRRLTPPAGEQPYNYALMHYLELGYILDLCELIARGALRRTESRGAHFRLDYPQRDDQNWLCHTFVRRGEKGPEFSNGPVSLTHYPPQERGY